MHITSMTPMMGYGKSKVVLHLGGGDGWRYEVHVDLEDPKGIVVTATRYPPGEPGKEQGVKLNAEDRENLILVAYAYALSKV